MLHLYRRHRTSCSHRSWTYRRCQCPIYVKGTLAGTFIKKSLDLTSWDAAQKLIGRWSADGAIGQLNDQAQTVTAAVAAFMDDAQTRELSAATIGKYRVLLERRLKEWAAAESVVLLPSLDLDLLTRFRKTWPDAPLAKSKNQERLKAFFRWCVARGWVRTSPAEGLTSIKVPHNPTLPFSVDEMSRIVDACDRYPTFNAYGYDNRSRVRAFVLLLRWSGLRIRDVVTLTWSRVEGGKCFLYTQKTGTHVYVPLPDVCASALEMVRREGTDHLFWTGNGLAKSAVADWQRSLRRLFTLANVENGHAHRFRDTFAVELLMVGVPIEDVSILLGHSSVKITEKHYSPWVAVRQRRLESSVRLSWPTAPVPPSNAAPPDGELSPQSTEESASVVPA